MVGAQAPGVGAQAPGVGAQPPGVEAPPQQQQVAGQPAATLPVPGIHPDQSQQLQNYFMMTQKLLEQQQLVFQQQLALF